METAHWRTLVQSMSLNPTPGTKKPYRAHIYWPAALLEPVMDFLAFRREIGNLPADLPLPPMQKDLVSQTGREIGQFTK
jgi:hypothetical protein